MIRNFRFLSLVVLVVFASGIYEYLHREELIRLKQKEKRELIR